MDPLILAVDAGGTAVKYALLRIPELEKAFGVFRRDMPSQGTQEEIFGVFGDVVKHGCELAKEDNAYIQFSGLSVPGPFDCERGVSLMRHKWAEIYGKPLTPVLYAAGLSPEVKVSFLHDVHAFLLGECRYGKAKDYDAAAGIILGTGLGFGICVNGELVLNETGGPVESIFNRPYKEGILEDYTAGKGIAKMYAKYAPGSGCTPEEIEALARRGDKNARTVYRDAGFAVGEGVKDLFAKYKIQCAVFGGRISNAFDFFHPAFISAVKQNGDPPDAYASHDPELSALIGAAYYALRHSDSNRTSQFERRYKP